MVGGLLYQEASSASIRALYGVSFLGTVALCVLEIVGINLQYSKFWNSRKSMTTLIPSRRGMLIIYTPALLAAISSCWIIPHNAGDGITRFLLLKLALIIHFLKRDLEVLLIHKFSGYVVLDSVIIISTFYLYVTAAMIYFHHRAQGFMEPWIDLKYLGFLMFLVGTCGNFYHHCLLSKLREKGEKGYKIPQGGLFGLIICPHYLFEIITFMGFAFTSQTVFACLCALGVALYLFGRSYSTRKWYLSKFEDFPRNVKALIPYFF